MDTEEKKLKLMKARNMLSEVFNDSKDEWSDNWWTKDLILCMGELDMAIQKINKPKPKGIKSII